MRLRLAAVGAFLVIGSDSTCITQTASCENGVMESNPTATPNFDGLVEAEVQNFQATTKILGKQSRSPPLDAACGVEPACGAVQI